jgi:GGDEF domain-containing protein
VAERLRASASREPVPWEGRGIALTLSVGGYSAVPVEGEGLELFLRRADEALYAAKARGRDRVELWSPQGQG